METHVRISAWLGREGKREIEKREGTYVADTPGGVAFLAGGGDLVRLAVNAFMTIGRSSILV